MDIPWKRRALENFPFQGKGEPSGAPCAIGIRDNAIGIMGPVVWDDAIIQWGIL